MAAIRSEQMRISTRGCYALRAVLELAMHPGRPVARQKIAARQGISANYIAQLFRLLRQAQLVKAIRGPGGGYMLARDAAMIRVGDVLRAVEGPLALSQCVIPENDPECQRAATCAVRPLLEQLTAVLEKAVDGITLQDLTTSAETQILRDSGFRK
jgi:Rrf2 family cysteine metabolism transcriptional repressor